MWNKVKERKGRQEETAEGKNFVITTPRLTEYHCPLPGIKRTESGVGYSPASGFGIKNE